MAARKGSTGASRGSSGKSNTKKSTATRKTSGTAKKATGSTAKKTQTKSRTTGRSSAKRATKSTAGKAAATGAGGSAVRSEIGILVAFALAVFGTLSVFGLCGSVGAVVRSFLYGVFGILACVVPLLFFLAIMFFVSNLGNGKALGKLAAALLIVPDLCGMIQLIVSPYVKGETLKEIYAAGTGGGWLGGAVKQGLCGIFDVVGAYLILVLVLLICVVVITEKSLTRWLRSSGERILGRAREDYDYRVEQNEENRARNEERRNEQRLQREERRRLAAERRRQEEENRAERRKQEDERLKERRRQEEDGRENIQEERTRRTDHKVSGVNIRDNTISGNPNAEDVEDPAEDAARGRQKTDGTMGSEEDVRDKENQPGAFRTEEDGRGVKPGASRSEENSRGVKPGTSRTEEDRRGAGTGDSGSYGRRNKDAWESDEELRGTDRKDPQDAKGRRDTDPGGSDPEDFDRNGRKSRETGRTGNGLPSPEEETGDVTVEWWNPHEHGDPVSVDDIDRLEQELKHAGGAGGRDASGKSEAGDNRSNGDQDRAGEADSQHGAGGASGGAGEFGDDYEDEEYDEPDFFADGVRRLDFMQERVSRRMQQFETAKPGRQEKSSGGYQNKRTVGGESFTETDGEEELSVPELTGSDPNREKDSRSEWPEEAISGRQPGAGTGRAGGQPGAGGQAGAGTGKAAGQAGTGTESNVGQARTGPSGGAAGTAAFDAGKPQAPPRPPYRKPPTSLLYAGGRAERDSQAELNRVADKLQDTLKRFGVNVTITDVSRGPSVTRYELLPEAGTRVNRITSLSDDIKLALAATDIRIEAPIPGKSAIGIEVPNKRRETVYLKELVESGELKGHSSKIAFAAGKDIAGKVVVADIAKMPHMLIAGTTGSGKSVFTNSIIMTILFRATPDEVKLIIIDPKVVEFGIYNGIPHLMTPVVTDPRKAAEALKWATAEMSRRYQTFANENVRDLKGYNKKIEKEHLTDKNGEPLQKLPQIVIIIDELADLMMVAAKDVEETICRLAQLARAAGIHLIIATQRPSVDVVTGLIKANIPSRVALLVSSGTDSRTIIDMNGAEKLLGNGDMLFAPSGYAKPVRLQGAFVSDEEVRSVVEFLKKQVPEGGACDASLFDEAETAEQEEEAGNRNERDELFAEAGRFLIEKKRASVSLLQRKFRVGFNRAARIIDQLEEAGVVGEELGTKPRNVLMTQEEFDEFLKSQG